MVRLSDVATVEYGAENDDVRVAFNGQEGTFLGIMMSPDANALDTSAAVREELPQIQSELPPGMTIELVYDGSDNIRGSIEEVFKTIAEAVHHRRAGDPALPRLVPLRAGADLHHPALARSASASCST